MKRILVVACENGYGHFRRLCSVLAELKDDASIDVIYGRHDAGQARNWLAAKVPGARMLDGYRTFIGWHGGSLRKIKEAIQSYISARPQIGELASACDVVVSDNLPDIPGKARHVVLGHFLWHRLYSEAWPGDPLVQRYAEMCESNMDGRELITIKYFTNREHFGSRQVKEVGLVPSVGERPGHGSGKDLAILVGGTGAMSEEARRAAKACRPESFERIILPQADEMLGAEFYGRLAGAVCRAGLGTISDCIAQKVPMALVGDNPETSYKARVAVELGVAVSAGSIEEGAKKLDSLSESSRQGMIGRMCGLDAGGAAQAAAFIRELL